MYFHYCNLFPLQAQEFIKTMEGDSSFYGLQDETLNSLLLTYLPSVKCKYFPRAISTTDTKCENAEVFLLKFLLEVLTQNAKFSIPEVKYVWKQGSTQSSVIATLYIQTDILLPRWECSSHE